MVVVALVAGTNR